MNSYRLDHMQVNLAKHFHQTATLKHKQKLFTAESLGSQEEKVDVLFEVWNTYMSTTKEDKDCSLCVQKVFYKCAFLIEYLQDHYPDHYPSK